MGSCSPASPAGPSAHSPTYSYDEAEDEQGRPDTRTVRSMNLAPAAHDVLVIEWLIRRSTARCVLVNCYVLQSLEGTENERVYQRVWKCKEGSFNFDA